MHPFNKLSCAALIAALALFLSACGTKGPLYIPAPTTTPPADDSSRTSGATTSATKP